MLVEQLGLRGERYHGAARQVAQQTEERSARKLDLLQRAVGLGKDIPDLFEEEDHGELVCGTASSEAMSTES